MRSLALALLLLCSLASCRQIASYDPASAPDAVVADARADATADGSLDAGADAAADSAFDQGAPTLDIAPSDDATAELGLDLAAPADAKPDGPPSIWLQVLVQKKLGSTSDERALAVVADGKGGAWVRRWVHCGGATSVSYGPIAQPCHGGRDLLLFHLDGNGKQRHTPVVAGGSADDEARGLLADGSGGVWVVGKAAGAFVYQPPKQILLTGAKADALLMHVTASGQVDIVRPIGGDGDDQYDAICPATTPGRLLLVGRTASSSISDGNVTLLSTGGDDILELEIEDMQGIPQVMRRQGGSGADRARACAGDGSLVVITGSYSGAPTIDGVTLSSFVSNTFLVRRGSLAATQAFNGSGVNRGTAANVAGGYALAGDFQGTLIIPGAQSPLASLSSQGIWFADYDTQGTLRSFGSLDTAGVDQAHAVLRVGGELWIVGEGEGSGISFSTTVVGKSPLSGGSSGQPGRKRDALVVRIRTSPIGLIPHFFGGAQDDAARAAARDGSGGAWVVGHFRGVATLIGGPLTAAGGDDIFVLRLKP